MTISRIARIIAGAGLVVSLAALSAPVPAAETLERLQAAAEAGDARAQNDLGWMYFTGDRVKRDYDKAFQWFKRAAEQGNATAQVNLGRMHADGLVTAMDFREAEKWYRRAAEQGHPMGQFNLGFMYAFPLGAKQDPIEGYKWLALAAPELEGQEKAIATGLLNRIRSEMSPEQVREAERQVRAYKPR
jgi:hypothetical protein